MIRTPLLFVPWLFMAGAVAFGLLWREGDQLAQLGHTVTTGTASIGGPFRLIDQDGRPRTDADFRGRYMLVYFGYSLCPDVCPTTLAAIADALGNLGGQRAKVVPIFITVDPDRDKPRVLKEYISAFGSNFVALTGSDPAVRKATQEYRVYFAKHPMPNGGYSVDHTSVLYLMGPDGKFITYYDDESVAPDALAADLLKRVH